MHKKMLNILCCPECRGDLSLCETKSDSAKWIDRGKLRCTVCLKDYPIESGIPRLVIGDPDVLTIGRRFNDQWLAHQAGQFEQNRCYGVEDRHYVGWLKEKLEAILPCRTNDWILDAGCGLGDKAALLAKMAPGTRVIGVDLGGDVLQRAVQRHRNIENLDYVEANILNPPFKKSTFTWGISIGVLHHTPNTQIGFEKFRELLKKDSASVIWIYPTAKEGPIWRLAYITRNMMMGCSHSLSPRVLRILCHILTALAFPITNFIMKRHAVSIRKRLPFFKYNEMRLGERYRNLLFNLYDTLLPEYQFHHSQAEVKSWISESGADCVYSGDGFYFFKAGVTFQPNEFSAGKNAETLHGATSC